MNRVKNIEDLREHAIDTLHRLERKEIETKEAFMSHKIYEAVISTCKAELEYCKATDQVPNIPFLRTSYTGECVAPRLENGNKKITGRRRKDDD
jgi:hypothetical protein